MRAAARGSGDAFGQLFEHYLPAVFEAAWVVLRDREEAARIARDTFVDAWAGVAQLPADSVAQWLLDGARDRAVDWLRDNDPERVVVPLAPDAPPPASVGPVLRSRIVSSLELRGVPTRARTIPVGKARRRRQPQAPPAAAPIPQGPPDRAEAAGAAPPIEPPTIPIASSSSSSASPPAPDGPRFGSPTPPRGGVLPSFGVATSVGAQRRGPPAPAPRRKAPAQGSPVDLLGSTQGRVALGAVACVLVVGFFLFQKPPGDDSPALPTGGQEPAMALPTSTTLAPGSAAGPTTTAAATTAPTTVPGTTPTTAPRSSPTTAAPQQPAPTSPRPTSPPAPKPDIGSFGGFFTLYADGQCRSGSRGLSLWWSVDDADSARTRPEGGQWSSASVPLGYATKCSKPGTRWFIEATNSGGTSSSSFVAN